MKYSHKIKEILKTKEITQTKLAFEFGVTFAALNRWINESSKPSKKNEKKINDVFDEISGKVIIGDEDLIVLKKDITSRMQSLNISKILQRPDFIKNLIIEMTYASNKIEGSTLTIKEVSDIIYENTSFSHRSVTEHIETKNHEAAILFVLDNYSTIMQKKN